MKMGMRTEDRLENWRGCLEDAGLKASRSKTEHQPSAGNLQKINMKEYDSDGQTTAGISIQIFDREGGCGTEVAKEDREAIV